MDFTQLGNLGDFVGGFGVIITVVYLALQIRSSTHATRTASYQSVVASISDWTTALATDKELTRIFRVGVANLDALEETEQAQFNLMLVGVLRHYENIHFQYSNGFISEETWEGWSNRIHGSLTPLGAKKLWDTQRSAFSKSFRDFVDNPPEEKDLTPVPSAFGEKSL